MTNPTPRRKVHELIDSINEMLTDGVNAERVEEIIVAANKMKEFGQSTDAYTVLGMIASLRGDSSEMNRLFTAAIRSGGRDTLTLGNYGAALSNLDQSAEAMKIMDELVDGGTTDLNIISEAIRYHIEAFDVDGARKLIEMHEALGHHIVDPKMDSELKELEVVMAEYDVTWPEMSSRVELAASVLHRLGLLPRSSRRAIRDGILLHEFMIGADVDIVSRAEIAINDAISGEPYTPVDDLLYLTCSAV